MSASSRGQATTVLGVMSDTHGNRRLMHEVADRMVASLGVSTIYHAGDDFADAEELDFAGHIVRMVPGLWCPAYTAGRVPRQILDHVDGLSVAMAHAEKDLRHVERSASVIITGHTHLASVERLGSSVYLNPGHLKAPVDRGQRPSFARIVLEASIFEITIHETSGDVRSVHTFQRDKWS